MLHQSGVFHLRAQGREFEPGTPVYNIGMSAADLKLRLGV
jgi:hypothetical protein